MIASSYLTRTVEVPCGMLVNGMGWSIGPVLHFRIKMTQSAYDSGIGKTHDEIWESFRDRFTSMKVTEQELLQIHKRWKKLGKIYGK